MKYIYRNTSVFYKFVDRKKSVTNVYLHGWGCSHKNLLFCDDEMKNQNSLFVDFPPFGKSGKVKGWSIFTYANMVIALCTHLGITKANLFGHSFGGRVALIIAVLCKDLTNKLILIDSAGLKPRRSIFFHLKVANFKLRRSLGLKTRDISSADYQKLDDDMKGVFKSVVNTHLDEFLPYVRCETLIVFGKNDCETPIYMAKRFKKKIPCSSLVLLDNAGHFCFDDRRIEFLYMTKKFVEAVCE